MLALDMPGTSKLTSCVFLLLMPEISVQALHTTAASLVACPTCSWNASANLTPRDPSRWPCRIPLPASRDPSHRKPDPRDTYRRLLGHGDPAVYHFSGRHLRPFPLSCGLSRRSLRAPGRLRTGITPALRRPADRQLEQRIAALLTVVQAPGCDTLPRNAVVTCDRARRLRASGSANPLRRSAGNRARPGGTQPVRRQCVSGPAGRDSDVRCR